MLPPSPFKLTLRIIIFLILGFHVTGCAFYYRDRDSGAEHIWGFGHLATKVTPTLEGKKALIQKMMLTGVSVGIDNGSLGVSVGYDVREHILIYDENTAISILRPQSDDPFYYQIGTYPPIYLLIGTDPLTYLPKEKSSNPNNSDTKKESDP